MSVLLTLACLAQSNDTEVFIQRRPDNENDEEETEVDERVDIDQDGFSVEDGDCDDWDPNINPNASEIWNYEDDDCDGYEDIDGLHAGELSLQAVGIYEGVSYSFSQQCIGETSRIEGHLSLILTCTIDSQQQMADLLLGGTIIVSKEADFVLQEDFYDSVLFTSSGGEMEWDAQGDVGLVWSELEADAGERINVLAVLDALYLDIQISGVLYRQ